MLVSALALMSQAKHSNTVTPEALSREIAETIRALPSSKTEPVRALRREFSKRLARTSASFVVDVALHLIDEPGVDRFVAYELIKHHREAAAGLRQKQLERLGRGLGEWGEVDCFACYLAGPSWREHQISDEVIHQWAQSKDRWWRRAALVSTVPLNSKAQGGSGDTERTLRICRLLLLDRDDMVVKAMSWALRELSKRDPRSVRRFLDANRDVIAARVAREVRNKITTGLKNPRTASRVD